MRLYYPVTLLLFLFPTILCAQQKAEIEEAQSPSFRVNAYPLEAEVELALGNSFSVMNTVGFGYSFQQGVGSTDFNDYDPYVQVFPRYYYNLANRLSEDKNIDGFSGNYVGLYTMLDIQRFLIGPTWGIQRMIKKTAHIDLFLGWGAGLDFHRPSLANVAMRPVAGIKVGIYLN